jgi:hypothetical protein
MQSGINNFNSETGEPTKCSYCGDKWEIYEDWKFAIYTKQFVNDENPEYACCLQCLRILIFTILPKTHENSDYFRLHMICCNSDYQYELFSIHGLHNMFNQLYLEISSSDQKREKVIDKKELNNYHMLLLAEVLIRDKLEEMDKMDEYK